MNPHELQRAWLEQVVAEAQRQRFYGTLEIKFEDGIVKRVTRAENLMPPSTQRTVAERTKG